MKFSSDKFSKELVVSLLQDGVRDGDAFTAKDWTSILMASLVDHFEFMAGAEDELVDY
jgi:hypothetical protein